MNKGFFVDEELEIHSFKTVADNTHKSYGIIVLDDVEGFDKHRSKQANKNSIFNTLTEAKSYVEELKQKAGRGWPPLSKDVKNFFNEYEQLCKKYNLSLGHEDTQGAFILHPFKKDNISWAKHAGVLDLTDSNY